MNKLFLSAFIVISFIIYSLEVQLAISGKEVATTSGVGTMSPQAGNASPSSQSGSKTALPTVKGHYKDGEYTGETADAFYGNVQVKVSINNGNITDVQFLDYPKDRGRSIAINTFAMPNLKSEVIAAQSANVDIVSGATATSQAFIQSLQTALNQAKS